MLEDEELMRGIIRYGRSTIQDVVARSQNVSDVVTYLHMEWYLEMIKVTSFVTTNLVSFEKSDAFTSDPIQATNHSEYCAKNTFGHCRWAPLI